MTCGWRGGGGSRAERCFSAGAYGPPPATGGCSLSLCVSKVSAVGASIDLCFPVPLGEVSGFHPPQPLSPPASGRGVLGRERHQAPKESFVVHWVPDLGGAFLSFVTSLLCASSVLQK